METDPAFFASRLLAMLACFNDYFPLGFITSCSRIVCACSHTSNGSADIEVYMEAHVDFHMQATVRADGR